MKQHFSIISHICDTPDFAISHIRVDSPHFELTLLEGASPSEEEEAVAVAIECTADKWRVLIVVKELAGWHWGEIRTLVVKYACESAFMHPDVFHSFITRFNEAGGGEWDPVR